MIPLIDEAKLKKELEAEGICHSTGDFIVIGNRAFSAKGFTNQIKYGNKTVTLGKKLNLKRFKKQLKKVVKGV